MRRSSASHLSLLPPLLGTSVSDSKSQPCSRVSDPHLIQLHLTESLITRPQRHATGSRRQLLTFAVLGSAAKPCDIFTRFGASPPGTGYCCRTPDLACCSRHLAAFSAVS